MEINKFNVEKIYKHLIDRSEIDFNTMNVLYNSKIFHWALFIGHLVIERLLKAKIVQDTNDHAPFIHDLRRLAKNTGIEFDAEQKRILDTITSFNLSAIYEDYNQEFYKKCTPDFAEHWINKIKEIRLWIKSKL